MGSIVSQNTDAEEDLQIENVEIDMSWPYIALISINMFILTPISVAMTYQYYLLRDSYLYNARRPMFAITVNIVSIIFIAIYTPIHIMILEIFWKNNATYDEWWDAAFFFTAQICIFVTFVLRTWHSFYDFKLAQDIANRQWKSILNEQYQNDDTSFIFKYHKSLGNSYKTVLYFLIIPVTTFLITFIIIIVNKVGYNTEYMLLSLSFIYLLAAVGVVIYIITYTWRYVYDNIYLRGEILFGCILLCITVFVEAIIFGVDILEYSVENE
eukprot:199566_1